MDWVIEGLKSGLFVVTGYYLSNNFKKDTFKQDIGIKNFKEIPFMSEKSYFNTLFQIKPFTHYIVKVLYSVEIEKINDQKISTEHESLFLIYYDIKNFKATCHDPVTNELIQFYLDEKTLLLNVKADTEESTIGNLTILEF